MNSEPAIGGLSARQRAIHKIATLFRRIKRYLKLGSQSAMLAAIVVLVSSCHEKTNGQTAAGTKQKHANADSIHKPKVDIKVNRHYDEKGNLVGFDSTYSSYYSNVEGDTGRMDSLMHRFDSFFNGNHPSFLSNEFNWLFFNDSLRNRDFFRKDFFLKRYELNDLYFRDMMKRMDSIKNRFYEESARRERSKDL